ncbi:MAG TPA: hypothetical protein VFQ38_18870 [Longimicrobiales bacterium]|nr:hypothetical protein [Longimicrobiales bacterium]
MSNRCRVSRASSDRRAAVSRWIGGVLVVLAGCAPKAPAATAPASQPTPPVADVEVERAAVAATALHQPVQLVFDWNMRDRDARFGGRGSARAEPDYKARLDLFGPRGEGYFSAAVVDTTLRVPAAVADRVPVPPPALLWSTLGVFHPPADARLAATRRQGDETRLDYTRGNERWRFTLVGGRLSRAELDRSGGRQTVELEGTAELGLPKRAVYRDYAAFRELTLTLDHANAAQPFPPDTWTPGAR